MQQNNSTQGWNSMNMIVKPNFFIVGAARSGTSSLAYNLGQHPDIYISPIKEPFYFVSDFGLNDFDEYISLFKDAGDARAIGEASTGYLFDEHAPVAIHELFPDAKIIIILRNPVDMAFSYWRFTQIAGNESKSFEEATSDEERRYRKTEEFKRKALNWWAMYLYIERAMYFSQVKRYFDIIGRCKVRVYIFEDFIKRIEELYKELFAFLDVDANFTPDYSVKNEGGDIHSQFLKKLRDRKYPFIKNIFPVTFRVKLKSRLLDINRKKDEKIIMNTETRRRLEVFFEEDIRSLEQLLGYSIEAWKKKEQQVISPF